ncbi:transposase [Actinacidiphila glaucinigra]|uniref:transposase n=1 Tax=Actinacidiphila glaucinigra TaxID=235986 RepID=UPI0035D72DBF
MRGEAGLGRDLRPAPRRLDGKPPRRVCGWILRRLETLTEPEQLQLKTIRTQCPSSTPRPAASVPSRPCSDHQGERLREWPNVVRQDDLPTLHALVTGIDRDLGAVIAGLTLFWSSGVVEGHVDRIRMIKRQMYGRAGFTFLRKRVLLAS